jgi:hypothetical protein
VSWVFVALLGLAVLAVLGAEWPRLTARFERPSRPRRERPRRKRHLSVVEDESDDFVASVERDLARLPTIEERDRKR